jgi:tetratricopeptide (TPR) repeat protein
MIEKIKCAHCKHRLAKRICGCPESPMYNQQIDMLDSCEFFVQNPAQPIYSKGLAAHALIGAGNEEMETEAIEKLETAIRIGLPEDDESYARLDLGEIFSRRGYKYSPGDIDHPDFSRGIQEMEKAVLMDSQGGYGIFSEPIHKAQLVFLAAAYLAEKDSIRQQKGIEAAIAYVEQKLRLFDYLSSPPLLLLQGLGELYSDKGNTDMARQTFTRILQTPISPADGELDADVRKGAKLQLQELD